MMLISELEAQLIELREEHGDLKLVMTDTDFTFQYRDVEEIKHVLNDPFGDLINAIAILCNV